MNESARENRDSQNLDRIVALDEHCDRFETELRAGRAPDIHAFLAAAEPAFRSWLLRELLFLELEFRRDRGERIEAEAYRRCFPDDAATVDAVLAELKFGPRGHPSDTGQQPALWTVSVSEQLHRSSRLAGGVRCVDQRQGASAGRHSARLCALDEGRHSLMEALLAEHLKLHHDDPERSLAAVSVGDSTRESLWALGDAQLNASLAGTVAQSPDSSDGDSTTTFSVGSATSDGQRFRVLRPHAKGGLGAVFVALDSELNREVALKQILNIYVDDEGCRQRFLLEAEITGGLEHPGIVPVYGLGTYPDGRPYYAMRLIRGETLKDAIARLHTDMPASRRPLELRKLLRRFLDVCNAIDYAHSRGVLHRDIKPSNVVLGKHGETLVVDWGLAKAIGRTSSVADPAENTLVPLSSGSAETLPGSTLGTPAYMSPEQAAGLLDRLGPASDVYSLGATLYCLLTSKPPFEGAAGEVLRLVQNGGFVPPRRRDPNVDRALEAVCLKAMALRPDDRYPTSRALAEEVENWLADAPVSARPDPLTTRAVRWMRKHQVAATMLIVLSVVAIPALLALNYVQRRQREHSEADFRQTRRAVSQIFQLARSGDFGMRPRPVTLEIMNTAKDYHEQFLRERSSDSSLMPEIAWTNYQLSEIYLTEAFLKAPWTSEPTFEPPVPPAPPPAPPAPSSAPSAPPPPPPAQLFMTAPPPKLIRTIRRSPGDPSWNDALDRADRCNTTACGLYRIMIQDQHKPKDDDLYQLCLKQRVQIDRMRQSSSPGNDLELSRYVQGYNPNGMAFTVVGAPGYEKDETAPTQVIEVPAAFRGSPPNRPSSAPPPVIGD